jgi:hypothetical protein
VARARAASALASRSAASPAEARDSYSGADRQTHRRNSSKTSRRTAEPGTKEVSRDYDFRPVSAIMEPIAHSLPQQQIKAVTAYLNHLG